MNQRTSDDRENEERLKYLQTQIQSLGVLQAQNSLVNNNGFTPWLQSQKQTEKENSVSGRQSLSANQAPKLTNRASFYDQNRNQAVNNQARVSVSGNRSPELTKRASFYENNDNQGINNQSRSSVSQNRYSGIHSNSKDDEAVLNAEGSKGFRQSTTSREVGNSSNAVKFSETIASQLPKKASFYQKQSLSDIDDLQEGDPNLEQRGRSSNYQQTNNSTGYQTTGETAEELRQSRSYPQPQSAMKRPANNQSHIPVSPRRQVEELSYRTVPVSPSPPNDSSKPISVFQGQSTKLIVPSPKPQPEIIENDSPTLSRPSSLKKTRIPSPTRLSRTSSFNESDNDVGKLSSSRKSVHSRTQSDLNSQPTKPKGRHILSGGEVIPIRPRTNSGSGAHLFDGPTPGGRARTKSNTSNNSVGKVPPNPFFTQTSSSHDEEIVNVLGNRTPEQALQSLESEIKALESLLFK